METSVESWVASAHWILFGLAFLVLGLPVISGFMSTAVAIRNAGIDKYIPSFSAVSTCSFLISASMCAAMLYHLPTISLIFSQIPKHTGIPDSLYQIYVSSFFFTIIVSIFRVFITLGEIDKGKFQGKIYDIFEASSNWIKACDIVLRFSTAVFLVLFIGSFVRLPFNTLDDADFFRVSPSIIAEINDHCLTRRAIEHHTLAHFDMDSCRKNKITETQSVANEHAASFDKNQSSEKDSSKSIATSTNFSLLKMANKFIFPSEYFLMPCFLAMLLWSFLAWRISDRSDRSSSLQMTIWSILLFIHLLIFQFWTEIAKLSNYSTHFLGLPNEASLGTLSSIGLLISIVIILLMIVRTPEIVRRLVQNWMTLKDAMFKKKFLVAS